MKFILNDENLIVEELGENELIVSGTINYYKAKVEYNDTWKNLNIVAKLIKHNEPVGIEKPVLLNSISYDVNLDGTYLIGFVGYDLNENNEKTYQISTPLKPIIFTKGAGQIKTANKVVPSASEWELYIAQIQEMLKNSGGTGGIIEETDPTVPQHVKDITEEDIEKWNNKSSGDGTSNYEDLENQPSINGITLIGNKTTEELGIVAGSNVNVVDEILEFSQTAIPKTFNLEIGYLNSTAEELDSDNYYRSDFIKIDNAFKYYLLINNTTDTSQTLCYYLFDENKNLINTRITIPVEAKTQKKATVYPTTETKYARILISKDLKDCLVRFYANETIEHITKKELKQATYGKPRTLDMLEYFAPNKKVVLVGDSFTQGLGSTEYVHYDEVDSEGNTVTITGNGYNYGVLHNLPNYESGIKLYASGKRVWHEAINGNGYAQRLKNYLQNKFGCTVKNYGMSGITSATLLSKTMNSENSDLATSGSTVKTIFNTQDDWELGSIGTDGSLVNSTAIIRTVSYIELSNYSGDVTVTTSDTNIPFKVFYYDDNGFVENTTWIRNSLILDKTKATKVLVIIYTGDLTNFSKITITAENMENIQVIEGVTNGFDTVFLTIGGNDRGFADYVSPSTGETITGKEQHRYNLRKLVEYILGEGKKLILMSMTPCEDDPDKNVPMWDIDEVIGEVAEEYNVPFVSNYKGMLEYCETTGIDIKTLRNIDGLHPTDEGYAVVEAIVCKGLGINEVDKNYVDTAIRNALEVVENGTY